MGLNRMMMKNGVDLKNIMVMMTVLGASLRYGFKYGSFGSLSPNPLPNGILVTSCYSVRYTFYLAPSSIKSCTINNITVSAGPAPENLVSYLKENNGKTIPVIFHFD